jgi:hypothetical protein
MFMKHLWKVAIVMVAIGLLFVGCKTKPTPEQERALKVEPQVYPPKVIEHKLTALGGDVPEWVFQYANGEDFEGMREYRDDYVFIFEQTGKDLEGVKAWTRSFSAATEVARMVSTRVMNKFAGAQVGDKDMVETYMEEVAKILAVAEYAGARKKDDFWLYRQYYDDNGKPTEKIYTYFLFYTVPREQIDAAIQRSLDAQSSKDKPKTEEEQVARDRVKELFSDGL